MVFQSGDSLQRCALDVGTTFTNEFGKQSSQYVGRSDIEVISLQFIGNIIHYPTSRSFQLFVTTPKKRH